MVVLHVFVITGTDLFFYYTVTYIPDIKQYSINHSYLAYR